MAATNHAVLHHRISHSVLSSSLHLTDRNHFSTRRWQITLTSYRSPRTFPCTHPLSCPGNRAFVVEKQCSSQSALSIVPISTFKTVHNNNNIDLHRALSTAPTDSCPITQASHSLRPVDRSSMAQSHHTGFSLFPLPPTPPANKQRAIRLWRDQQQQAIEALPQVQDEIMEEPQEKIQSRLRPAPLRLRKRRSAQQKHTSAKPTLRVINPDPKTPDQSVVDLTAQAEPAVPAQPFSFPVPGIIPPTPLSSPSWGNDDLTPWPTLVTEDDHLRSTQSAPPLLKRKSYRNSQWIDLNGQVDRKKLSIYLTKALDSSFQVIDAVDSDDLFQTPALRSPRPESNYGWCKKTIAGESTGLKITGSEPAKRALSYYEDVAPQFAASKSRAQVPTLPSSHLTSRCACPPGVLLCKTCSSQEFENFRRRQSEHKPNPSVSSTKCLLAVPRARFRTTLKNLDESPSPSSPPGLMFDSDEGEDSDWSVPNSPDRAETPIPAMQETPTPAPRPAAAFARPNAVSRSNVPSFSLPFSHGRQIRPRVYQAESNRTSARHTFSSSPSSTVPTLASISTISTFAFDFSNTDAHTDYDPFDESYEHGEIRTYEPVQKAKPVLVHCRGPSPVTIKYGNATSFRSRGQESADSGYNTLYV